MELGIETCTKFIIKSGKSETTEAKQFPNQERKGTLVE